MQNPRSRPSLERKGGGAAVYILAGIFFPLVIRSFDYLTNRENEHSVAEFLFTSAFFVGGSGLFQLVLLREKGWLFLSWGFYLAALSVNSVEWILYCEIFGAVVSLFFYLIYRED